jgi:hypothetical protein
MTLDQTYFFWGCGKPVQYGLYSPVVDRLVCVDDDYQWFEYVMFLMSSKIRLLIVPLHCAPNFQVNMIDNTCCTSWGITNWPDKSLDWKFSVPLKKRNFFFDTCGDLIEKSNKDLVEIQNFIFLSCHVLKFFKLNTILNQNYQYQMFSNLIKLPFAEFEQIKEIELNCNQTIYLSNNYSEAEEKIQSLVSTAEDLICNL